jgi:hypothetical protein
MTTTTVLSDESATIVRDDASRFSWGPVVAGAVIATAVTFFLVSLGTGLGLALTSAHKATVAGTATFLTLGAIYFMAAQAFGFAVGGHVTGRLMPDIVENNEEEESFRADAHGLAVWALAVVFGLALAALAAFVTASATVSQAATPPAYWADKLLAPASVSSGVSAGASSVHGTLADAKAEAARLLAVDAMTPQGDASNGSELARLVVEFAGLSPSAATVRVRQTEEGMQARTKEAADAARKAASYLGIWTAIALLFGAVVCVAATVSARAKDEYDMFGRRRTTA